MKKIKKLHSGLVLWFIVSFMGSNALAATQSSLSSVDQDAAATNIVSQIADFHSFQIGITCPSIAVTARCALAVVNSSESKQAFKKLFPTGLVVNNLTVFSITLSELLLDGAITVGN